MQEEEEEGEKEKEEGGGGGGDGDDDDDQEKELKSTGAACNDRIPRWLEARRKRRKRGRNRDTESRRAGENWPTDGATDTEVEAPKSRQVESYSRR